jgi:hypothetical protein
VASGNNIAASGALRIPGRGCALNVANQSQGETAAIQIHLRYTTSMGTTILTH